MYCSIRRVEACYRECGQSVCTAAFKGWRLVTVSVGSLCVLQHSKDGGLLL